MIPIVICCGKLLYSTGWLQVAAILFTAEGSMQSLSNTCSADVLDQENLILLDRVPCVALCTYAGWQCILSAGKSNGLWRVSPLYLLLFEGRKDLAR